MQIRKCLNQLHFHLALTTLTVELTVQKLLFSMIIFDIICLSINEFSHSYYVRFKCIKNTAKCDKLLANLHLKSSLDTSSCSLFFTLLIGNINIYFLGF